MSRHSFLPYAADLFMCCRDKVLKCRDKLSVNSSMLVLQQSLLYRDIPPSVSSLLCHGKEFVCRDISQMFL